MSKPGKVATSLLVFSIVFLNYFCRCRVSKTVGLSSSTALTILKVCMQAIFADNSSREKTATVKYFILKTLTGAGYSSQWQKRPELTRASTNRLPTIRP